MQVITRADGVTVIDDAYNANPDSMRAGLQALASIAHQAPRPRRSWAVLGEMAELGDDAITEHDRIGRLAVRLDVSRLVVVGTGRSMSAMHHGAVMEGSSGRRPPWSPTPTPPWHCCGPNCGRGRGADQGVQRRRPGRAGGCAGRGRSRRRPGVGR
ncbi:mur ligase family, glutamate ligase domain protein [Mycobacterium xenopi 3993]|nr:mur ligase family, glutamate ligase domain protein [Mycobacterium xenopi 3993]